MVERSSDRDYFPLTTSIARGLNDRMYEKRKQAALDVERLVKDMVIRDDRDNITKLIKILESQFTSSPNPHSRKGGLIGLAASAIALGNRECQKYLTDLIIPVIDRFKDSDSRVRYYACEGLYNISKVARSSIIRHFERIFNGLFELSADTDPNVKGGLELLDKLTKDTVCDHIDNVEMLPFIKTLAEKLYSPNEQCRMFLVSWIVTLNREKRTNMLQYLSEILDGLFCILQSDNAELTKSCESCLDEFILNIRATPHEVNFASLINILSAHAILRKNLRVQYYSLVWLKESVNLAGRQLLSFIAVLLQSILPYYAYTNAEQHKAIVETAVEANTSLESLITSCDDASEHEGLENDIDTIVASKDRLHVRSVVEALEKLVLNSEVETKLISLKWLKRLFVTVPYRMFSCTSEIFPVLLDLLLDPSSEVAVLTLQVLAQVASSDAAPRDPHDSTICPSQKNSYFRKLLNNIMDLFSQDQNLFENERGTFIIRNLCYRLPARDVYWTFADLVYNRSDRKYIYLMVTCLNRILMTSSELFLLRAELKAFKEETRSLFHCLYRSWCYCPVATVSLCLLSQNYQHACALLQVFGNLEITVEFLCEIDKLVQMLESPIFSGLRLQLLDVPNNYYLVKALRSILMLLPQSNAFHTLRKRLKCIPQMSLYPALDQNANAHNTLEAAGDDPQLEELVRDFEALHTKPEKLPSASSPIRANGITNV